VALLGHFFLIERQAISLTKERRQKAERFVSFGASGEKPLTLPAKAYKSASPRV